MSEPRLLPDPRHRPEWQCRLWGEPGPTPLFAPHKLLYEALHQLLTGASTILAAGRLGHDKEQPFAEVTGIWPFLAAEDPPPDPLEQLLSLADGLLAQGTGQPLAWFRLHKEGQGISPDAEESRIHRAFLTEPWHSLVIVEPYLACLACYRFSPRGEQRHGFFTMHPVHNEQGRAL